jgi:Na+/melibiose symporter-like transporter
VHPLDIGRKPASVICHAVRVQGCRRSHPTRSTALNIPLPSRHLYAAGHFVRTLAWSFVDLTLAYYLHTRLAMPAPRIGQLLAASFTYSSVLDLLMAAAFTRVRDQHRLALRLQMIGGLGTAACACLLFLPFPPSTQEQTYWQLLGCSLAFRTFYALYDVAQNALTSLLPEDDVDAERYVALHATAIPCAKLCVAAAMFAVIGERSGMRHAAELWICMVIALLIVLTCMPLACNVGRPPPVLAKRAERSGVRRAPLLPLLPVLMATAVEIVLVGVLARLFPFASHGAALTLALVIGMLAARPGIAWLQRRLGSEARVILLLSGSGIVGAVALLEIASALPAILCATLHGFSRAGTGLIKWRRTARIARLHACRSGHQVDLSCFALLTGTMKLALGLSSLLAAALFPGVQAHAPATVALVVVMLTVGSILSTVLLTLPYRQRAHIGMPP